MDQSIRDALLKISVATINTQLHKKGYHLSCMNGVRPLNAPYQKIVGEAYTLRFVPGREDLNSFERLSDPDHAQRRAIEEAPADSVLVIDARGISEIGVVGDILIERLKVRGVAGIVSDGGIRDLEECQASGFAMYGPGAAAPASVSAHSPADVQCTIGCGGIAVVPGDIIVGDGDGVAVIPAQIAAAVAKDGLEQERFERFAKMKVAGGTPSRGTYPPNEATQAEYLDWIEKGEPAF